MDRFVLFKENYDKAIETINSFLKDESKIKGLTQWLLNTDTNPYSYLPEKFAESMYSADAFASILRTIHHALFDDGEMEFVIVNGEPRMVFMHRSYSNFEEYVLTEEEKYMKKYYNTEFIIKVLDIDPNDFGKLSDAYNEKMRKEMEEE